MTLANKYRPTDFSDVVEQEVICKVLNKQIEANTYSHALLFSGNAGCGKTTCARIFANKIDGDIIELDCASHNGVAEIKDIVDDSRNRSIRHKYKVYILDECHTLTPQAWASLLIVLEENLEHSIFIFCTTDSQKIPNTIISRVQRFNFIPISTTNISKRVKQICEIENIDISDESLEYISKSANGNLRQALTNLDKCLLYDDTLSSKSICKALNIISLDIMGDLYNAYTTNNINEIIRLVEEIYNNGYNLHHFIRQFLDYCLKKPNINLLNTILTINTDIRYDDNPKNIIIARLITGEK